MIHQQAAAGKSALTMASGQSQSSSSSQQADPCQQAGTKNTMIDSTQINNSTTSQLVGTSNIEQHHNILGQFNYNPLYLSSHESASQHLGGSTHDDKNLGQAANEGTSSTHLMHDSQGAPLNDIYQYQQHFDQNDVQQGCQSSNSSSPSSVNPDNPCDMIDSQRGQAKQRQHQIYSSSDQPTLIQRNVRSAFIEDPSILITGTNRQTLRRSNQKGSSGVELDRKRIVAMNNNLASANFDHQQQQYFQQQQPQFMVASTSGHPMDVSEECNGGLFVEYQTNRNNLGGLEELHSLNVTNCDSETLEEHINMLSGEDCFAPGDDLQDFAIGSTNDHFLNMLTLGAAGGSLTTSVMGMGTQNIQSQTDTLCAGMSQTFGSQQVGDQAQTIIRTIDGKSNGELRQHLVMQDEPLGQVIIDKRASCTGKSNQKEPVAKAVQKNGTSKRTKTRKRIGPSNESSRYDNRDDESLSITNDDAIRAAAVQEKITTTNTNKRLLPAKKNNSTSTKPREQATKRKGNSSSSWTSSPSSSSVSTNSSFSGLSPSSSSQLDMTETPYRQQLENLKKKLKMDAPPPPISNDELPSIEKQQDQQKSNIILSQQPDQGYLRTMMNHNNSINLNGGTSAIVMSSQDAANCLQSTNSSAQKQQSCSTTYVIARQIEQPQGFEAAPGTIYLRTSNGNLVQLNSDRRSATVVQIGRQTETDFTSSSSSSTSVASANSSPLVISCVGSSRNSTASSYVNGAGAGQQQHQQYLSSPMNSQGPTAGIIFQPKRSQQQTNDEPLISNIDIDGNQTLLIPSNGPDSDDRDPTSLVKQHHHQQQKHTIHPSEESTSSSQSAASLMSQGLFSGPVILQHTD